MKGMMSTNGKGGGKNNGVIVYRFEFMGGDKKEKKNRFRQSPYFFIFFLGKKCQIP